MMISSKSFLTLTSNVKEFKTYVKWLESKVSENGKKVIFPIMKDLPRFLVPCLEGISRYSTREIWPTWDEGFLEKLWIFQKNNIKILEKWQITIIPLEEWIITKMPLQSESEHLQWPSEKYLSKLKSQPLDLPQIRIRSRQRTDHHIPRLVFKAKVSKALIGADFLTNYLERSISESRRI